MSLSVPLSTLEGLSTYSPRATLAGLGFKLQKLGLFQPFYRLLHIKQKTVKHRPVDKIYDAFITLLTGIGGLVELNKVLKADLALQKAFGRDKCAEQSVVQQPLDACTAHNLLEAQVAFNQIYRQFGQGYHHNYRQRFQLLDVDLTGLPCGKKAALATKGYFAKTRNRRGRQLGRVIATHYHEIVTDHLLAGNLQLNTTFQTLVSAAEKTLDLSQAKRLRTILRVDSGAGTVENINWTLARGYYYHGKDYSGQRSQKLMKQVNEWFCDPQHQGREVGWVVSEDNPYQYPVKRMVVRCRKANGQWAVGVIVSNLSGAMVLELTGQERKLQRNPAVVALAYAYFYDQRGGGVESEIKQDKQGLGLTKRNKKSFEGQAMLVLLNALAHNVLVWAKKWLCEGSEEVAKLGIKRLVRDIFGISGFIEYDQHQQLSQLQLNGADPFGRKVQRGLANLLRNEQVVITLGKT